MNRNTGSLAIILLLTLCIAPGASAQGFTFTGKDVLMLAKTIAMQANTSNKLPPAYVVPLNGKAPATIPASVAFEILAKAMILWQANSPATAENPYPSVSAFPEQVTGVPWILKGPKYNEKNEPAPEQRYGIPVASMDILAYAQTWVQIAQAQQNTISEALKFRAGYKLTAAQYLVAMAMLIDLSQQQRHVPATLLIPAVHSPQSWDDTRNPIPIIEPVALELTLNGIKIPRGNYQLPDILNQPFCGTIPLAITTTGPVAQIRLLLDDTEVAQYAQAGAYTYPIDTMRLTDETHTLTVIVEDTGKSAYPVILSLALKVRNGRVNGFTPAQLDASPTNATSDSLE